MGRPFLPMTAAIGGPAIQVAMGVVDTELPTGDPKVGFTRLAGKDAVNLSPGQFKLRVSGTWEDAVTVTTDTQGGLIIEGANPTSAGDYAAYLGEDTAVDGFFGGKVPPFLIVATI